MAALGLVGAREDAHAQAIRGIALAQLGELDRAKVQLAGAARAFERSGETAWIVKARAALAEIGFATRDLDVALAELDAAPLRALGDEASASYVEIQKARLLAMLGRVDEAHALLARLESGGPAAALARMELCAAAGRFRDAAAVEIPTGNVLLAGEARALAAELRRPAFDFFVRGATRRLALTDIEAIDVPYVDTLRRRFGALDLARRTSQLELLVALAHGPVTAASLFGRASDSLMARLRMEITRLRQDAGLVITATEAGFVAPPLGLLLPEAGGLEALLADGEAWPPRAIAAVLGESVRTVQRRLEDHPHVSAEGVARTRRYRLRHGRPGIATRLLLLTRR